MPWPWVRREELERARAARAEELRLAREEIRELRAAIERMTDNALFAAGWAPVFDPEAARFQVRDTGAQSAAQGRAGAPMTAAEWRRQAEHMAREAAERDRRAQVASELKRIAEERRPAPSGGQQAQQPET